MTKLYCPKCKKKIAYATHSYMGIDVFHCISRGCQRYYFEWDCLTEEQLKKKNFYDEVVKQFESAIEKVYDESKQPPSFCFAEGKDVNELHEVNTLLNKVGPLVIKVTDYSTCKFGNDTNVAIKETEINDINDKDAVEWINFDDRMPEFGQRIKFDEYYTGKYIGVIDGKGRVVIGNHQYSFEKWKPAANNDSTIKESSTVEDPKLDNSQPCKSQECEHDLEPKDALHCKKCELITLFPITDKSQSQIAIEKVIEALKPYERKIDSCIEKMEKLQHNQSFGILAIELGQVFRILHSGFESISKKLEELNK